MFKHGMKVRTKGASEPSEPVVQGEAMEASTWKAVLFCLPVHMDCSARCGDERMVASPVVLARTVKAIDHRSCKQVAVTPIEIRIRFNKLIAAKHCNKLLYTWTASAKVRESVKG